MSALFVYELWGERGACLIIVVGRFCIQVALQVRHTYYQRKSVDPHARAMKLIILTLNSLSRIKLRLGQVEELVCSRMKYSRLYVILLHLVLSAKSVYNF